MEALLPMPPAVRARLVCLPDGGVQLELEALDEQEVQQDAGMQQDVDMGDAMEVEAAQEAAAAHSGEEAADATQSPSAGTAGEPEHAGLSDAAALQQQHAALLAENERLQRLVRQHLDSISKASRKSLQEAAEGLNDGADQRYQLALQQLRRLVAQREAATAAAAAALAPERARLAVASEQVLAQRAGLLQFVSQVAAAAGRAAANGQARAALPERALQHFLAADGAKGGEVRALRAAGARLAHQLAAAERRLKEADQLSSEGLHLVDFEQTRIENAALAGKREARGAEVEKLRGRLVQAVQITAHVREKLHCAQQERGALAATLAAAEAALAEARSELTAAKEGRERWKRERGELTQDWRIVSDKRCLEDMAAQQARLAQLQAQVAELQARYEAGELERAATCVRA